MKRTRFLRAFGLLTIVVHGLLGSLGVAAPPQPPQLRSGVPAAIELQRLSRPLLTITDAQSGTLALKVDPVALAELKAISRPVLLESVPLGSTRVVNLEVERFRVTLDSTQFVVGRENGESVPFDFDPDSVVLLRGRIAGELHSHVFLALAEHMTNGLIESTWGQLAMTSRSPDGAHAGGADKIFVFPSLVAGPNPPLCQMHDHGEHDRQLALGGTAGGGVVPGLRQVELAIETDYEFFQIFSDKQVAATYLVQLYGAVSDIFMRNINTRFDLTFVRIWDSPNEPFEADLLEFQSYWNQFMGNVHRDVAQMFSGRGDLPGGVAYVTGLCVQGFAYAFCGNAVGHFVGIDESSVYNYDLQVTAHELGHSCGSLHTHDYDLDICNAVNTPPQRGTLMSYCSQTVSGGAAVMDMDFHAVTQAAMKGYTYGAPCVALDCNQNGVVDNIDVMVGVSADVNVNGIPDECEPDCNLNGLPDDLDILLGVSLDLHGNNIPDECEADCDANGISDYSQIMADMMLDRNRNVILDECEDCDGDGLNDLVELDGAWNVWAASSEQSVIREYHAVTGVLMDTSAAGHVSQPSDLIVAPGRRVLVSSTATNKIVEFDHHGNFVRDLVSSGAGGLSSPAGMVISPAGTLLVASRANHRVLEFDLLTGAFIGAFVSLGSGGLSQPLALTYGPDGHLYVSSASNQVFKYHGQIGTFLSIFINSDSNGGLSQPRGMVFKPDGNLLVTSFANNSVLEFNGATGAFIRNWASVGVAFDGPWCIRIAPNGHVHVSTNLVPESHLTQARIHEFNVDSGNWIRGFVMGADSALAGATGFDYLPGDRTDCNMNQLPDNCDIASGFSADANANGIPDECEGIICTADITDDGMVNVEDLLAVINQWGPCADPDACAADIAPIGGDDRVGVEDLLAVVNAWGPCQ